MTPEEIEQIRDNVADDYVANMRSHGVRPFSAACDDVSRLLDYVDVLHEDLRLTRAERDAEKHKRAQQSREHTAEVLAWDALAVDTRAKAYDQGCRDTYEWILARQNGEQWDEPKNPYGKDTP